MLPVYRHVGIKACAPAFLRVRQAHVKNAISQNHQQRQRRTLATAMPFPAFDIIEYRTPEFNRYAKVHEQSGDVDERPTALQIVKDNDLESRT